jgi:hypothetical protein
VSLVVFEYCMESEHTTLISVERAIQIRIGGKHLPADSTTVAAFWRMWFALATVLAFRQILSGGIGGQ